MFRQLFFGRKQVSALVKECLGMPYTDKQCMNSNTKSFMGFTISKDSCILPEGDAIMRQTVSEPPLIEGSRELLLDRMIVKVDK